MRTIWCMWTNIFLNKGIDIYLLLILLYHIHFLSNKRNFVKVFTLHTFFMTNISEYLVIVLENALWIYILHIHRFKINMRCKLNSFVLCLNLYQFYIEVVELRIVILFWYAILARHNVTICKILSVTFDHLILFLFYDFVHLIWRKHQLIFNVMDLKWKSKPFLYNPYQLEGLSNATVQRRY